MRIHRPYAGEPLPTIAGADALVVLGGSMSANDDDKVAWLGATRDCCGRRWPRAANAGDLPGPSAAGRGVRGPVGRNPAGKQMGLFPLGLTSDGRCERAFATVADRARCVQWNDDIVLEACRAAPRCWRPWTESRRYAARAGARRAVPPGGRRRQLAACAASGRAAGSRRGSRRSGPPSPRWSPPGHPSPGPGCREFRHCDETRGGQEGPGAGGAGGRSPSWPDGEASGRTAGGAAQRDYEGRRRAARPGSATTR